MLSIKDEGLLLKIIKHCNRIEITVNKLAKEDFLQNEDYLEIVCFNIIQIGELVKKLDKAIVINYAQIPWKKISGMRDVVVHGYGTISKDRVWETIEQDIAPLKRYCEGIIKNK